MTWSKKLEEIDLFWLKDPSDLEDIMGIKKLADALNVPVALGEYVYTGTGGRLFEGIVTTY